MFLLSKFSFQKPQFVFFQSHGRQTKKNITRIILLLTDNYYTLSVCAAVCQTLTPSEITAQQSMYCPALISDILQGYVPCLLSTLPCFSRTISKNLLIQNTVCLITASKFLAITAHLHWLMGLFSPKLNFTELDITREEENIQWTIFDKFSDLVLFLFLGGFLVFIYLFFFYYYY